MSWLAEFSDLAQRTDRFTGKSNHLELLAAGLMGEAGSIVAELKKSQREQRAYPAYRCKMLEEIGDFLWYFVRLVSVVDSDLLANLETPCPDPVAWNVESLSCFLELGAGVGALLTAIGRGSAHQHPRDLRPFLRDVWNAFIRVSIATGTQIRQAAENNLSKLESRWPSSRCYLGFFDGDYPEEEQLPRWLEVEFRERVVRKDKTVIVRCNGLNLGDRLTDNIADPDGYRYHDIFHLAHATHLGWSPVIRALLRCKRKSSPLTDEREDGARAVILEEAIVAMVFSRAKQLEFFEEADHLDYALLKTISELVQGYEVERAPLWQWEAAILDGYRVFRQLRCNDGGIAVLDLHQRELRYDPRPAGRPSRKSASRRKAQPNALRDR
jgi:NTP pyrophosphatase (non-canonical NTP hydrolase)